MKSKEFWVDCLADGARAYHLATFDMQEGNSGQITVYCDDLVAGKWDAGGEMVFVHRMARLGDESAAKEDTKFIQQLVGNTGAWKTHWAMTIKPIAKDNNQTVHLPPVDGAGKGLDAPWTLGETSFKAGLDADRVVQISYNNPIPGPFHLILNQTTIAAGGTVRFYIKWQCNK